MSSKSESNRIQFVGIVESNSEVIRDHFDDGSFHVEHTVIIRIESPNVLNGTSLRISCAANDNAWNVFNVKGQRVSFELDQTRLEFVQLSPTALIDLSILK